MQSAEVELKFPVGDVAALQAGLPALGLGLLTPRTFEHNVLFDTPERSLRARRQILRIREYGDRCVLTHKRPPEGADDSVYKTRIETETLVEDCAAVREVFAQLGYEAVFIYDKFRTEWEAPVAESEAGRHLVIDETPIGTWAELEGATEWIDQMLDVLGVDRAVCLTESYGRLFETWKQETGSAAEVMTFEAVRDAAAAELAAR